MQMSKTILSAVGLMGVIALGSPSQGEAKETLTFATYVSEVYSTSQADIWLMDEIEKRSNGEITFERYFSGSLLKAPDLFPGLSRGAVDIVAGVPSAYNRNDYPLSNVTLPFITEKSDAVTKAFGELYKTNADLRNEYEGRNAKLLYTRGYAENTIWSRVPITKASDYKGLKIRAVLAIADVVEALGATTVAVPFPEAVEGMGRGVVDAMTAAPFDSAIKGGLSEVGKFGSDGGRMGVYAANMLAINLDRWNSLSPEDQKLITEVTAEAAARFDQMHAEEVKKAAEKLCATVASSDLKINLFTDEAAAEVREIAFKPITDAWIKWASESANVDAKKVLDDYISLIRKYEPESTYKTGFEIYTEKCGS
ncbi:TRAP transporter substrate-binding protein DctP [uncultured Sneathiella sp.]|uniref:TRAP transporter substrate-binding protein DctP n=1 Tax=uncultured Sneathiella sp. TaxID=879315 RepID=UPI0030EDFE37|tara:strand:- start:12849 stop:13949 length:1101 start_codon:yes stop_codon:yes gene_type:complete